MKRFVWCLGFISALYCGCPIFAQDGSQATNTAGVPTSGPGISTTNIPTSFSDGTKIVAITPHATTYFVPDGQTNRLGQALGRKIVATCTGGTYWTGSAWAPSDPTFEPSPEGDAFVANRVNHRARISTDLNSTNAIT